MKSFGFFFIFLSSLCSANTQLSLEQQAYEFVFNEIMQDAVSQINIVSTYKYGVLNNKTFVSALEQYPNLGKMPAHILRSLFLIGNAGEKVDWKPIMVNAQFFNWISQDLRPDRYYYVSKVAVDEDNLEAILLIGYHCPVLCGAHDTVVHVKKYGLQWKVISAEMLWIS
jgi:hypothetical protein